MMQSPQELFHYTMMPQEKVKVESLREQLIEICDALEVPRQKLYDGTPYMGRLKDNAEFVLKYKDDVGYYAAFAERGDYTLNKGFPTPNADEAKFLLLKSEFESGGSMLELNNRERLTIEWAQKYIGEYDSRKYWFEYTIKMIKTVFKTFPEYTCIEYTNYMNKWFDDEHWQFNKTTMTFEEV